MTESTIASVAGVIFSLAVSYIPGLKEKYAALPAQMKALDKAWHLTGTGNGEIAFRWYVATVRAGYTDARPAIDAFIERIGRRKLIIPIYEELARSEDGKRFAIGVYEKAKAGYHPLTRGSVEKVLGLDRKSVV